MILGVVKIKNRDAKVAEFHVVARCSADYQNFNKNFLTKIKLMTGDRSIYFIPIRDKYARSVMCGLKYSQ